MRNDYPDHPAGPLTRDPDPSRVLEVRRPSMNAWIVIILGFILLFSAGFVGAALGKVRAAKAREKGAPVKPAPPIGLGLGLFGLVCLGGGAWMLKDRRVTVRVRPDGLDFPMEGMPSVTWSEVEHVDIATLVLLGAGGPQDYLGIKLRPGVLTGASSPYSTMVMRAARAVAGWDFDICLSQNNLDLCPAHLAMEMRARLESVQARGSLPPPPEGLAPIGSQPFEERARVSAQEGPAARGRQGCALSMLGCGGFLALPFVLYSLGKFTPKVADVQRAGDVYMVMAGLGILLGGVAMVFVWPWADDEEE